VRSRLIERVASTMFHNHSDGQRRRIARGGVEAHDWWHASFHGLDEHEVRVAIERMRLMVLGVVRALPLPPLAKVDGYYRRDWPVEAA
jgi:hypothetical protein